MHQSVAFPIAFELAEGRIEARIEMPSAGERLVMLAYKVMDLSSTAAEMGVRAAQRCGMTVSCAKGCGACCRQLVPLSPPEAGMVYEFVKNMPEPRRSVIAGRFQRAVEQFRQTGLLNELRRMAAPRPGESDDLAVTRAYFSRQVPCPFLEDESCSIYPVRPSMCREYLVASPPEHCRDPFSHNIDRLPLSIRLSQALTRMWAAMTGRPPQLIPFILALEWTRENPSIRSLAAEPRTLVGAFEEQVRAAAVEIEKNGG
jgi:Fe-S-cluster containining protein